jgi:mono/diheme cytochrome c family protein
MHPNMMHRLAGILIPALSIFLIFCLLFEQHLHLPLLLSWGGRMHPLVLHFPIVLLLLAATLHWSGRRPRQDGLLAIASLSALLSAITGVLLGLERGEKGDLLTAHQWAGAALALLAAAWYGLEVRPWFSQALRRTIMAMTAVLVTAVGHTGGSVTHGADFLKWPGAKAQPTENLPDDPDVFSHLVMPLLEDRCVACHNSDRTKGGLLLTGLEEMLEGGESGPALKPGDPEASELIRRLHLPLEDEAHMPPPDKPQLNPEELTLLAEWIDAGAPGRMLLSEMEPFPRLAGIVAARLQQKQDVRWGSLPAVDESKIQAFRSHYISISRLAGDSQALTIQLYPHANYSAEHLQKLKSLAPNIVELVLSGIPVSAREMGFAAACPALETLVLDRTPVEDALLEPLREKSGLKVLRLSQTNVSDRAIPLVLTLGDLQKLSIWGTAISEEGLRQLASGRGDLQVISGIDPEIRFSSVLPPPVVDPPLFFFRDQARVKLRHPLAGIRIHYTTDGSEPDAASPLLEDSLRIASHTLLKYFAARDGWQPSAVDSAVFHLSGLLPRKVDLLSPPDPKYPGRGSGSLFDLKKGSLNIQDSAWLGFHGKTMEVLCELGQETRCPSITLSCLVNTGPHVFPPARIEVFGGSDQHQLQLLGRRDFPAPSGPLGGRFAYYTCTLANRSVRVLRIRVTPLSPIPGWHDAKGQPGWLFVDEILVETAGSLEGTGAAL